MYVSVLALRGRISEVPWYSLFTWGWREPLSWARSFWYDGREYHSPTAMVDLSKPSFKFGVAALQVGMAAHELTVKVSTDRTQYAVRQKVQAHVQVTQTVAGGKATGAPLAGTEVTFVAVDESLLELRPNESWNLLNAMWRKRAWGVETSTAQGEIIGRRHYGRKAVAAGGGGGRGGTRELFDTLLLWQATVKLDAKGEARIEVPLNDSLTRFRLVAMAAAQVTPRERDGERALLDGRRGRPAGVRDGAVEAREEGKVSEGHVGLVAWPRRCSPAHTRRSREPGSRFAQARARSGGCTRRPPRRSNRCQGRRGRPITRCIAPFSLPVDVPPRAGLDCRQPFRSPR